VLLHDVPVLQHLFAFAVNFDPHESVACGTA
jgi:hypothetical protein